MNNEKETMPLISVIIPIYNSFNLIEKCLHSLEEQTNRNFEVIFIDDCSIDNSYENLKEHLKQFSFNYQIDKNVQNSGPGISRNNGIKKSRGKYITFVDSDDYISEKFVENIEKVINESNPDAIILDYYMEMNNKYKLCYGLPIKKKKIPVIDALALCRGMCWGKVYCKSIIIDNNITFPNLIRSEDIAFCKVFISKCKNIYYLSNPLYYYIENNQSIMHNKSTMNILNNIKAFEYINENVENNEAMEMIFIREYLYLIVQIMILENRSTKEIKRFIDEGNKKYINWCKNYYIRFQPLYLRITLMLIKYKAILPIKMILKLKRK